MPFNLTRRHCLQHAACGFGSL
ncbi:hypothetical protein E3A20_30030, partial [Planctomyces bekefii]